MSDSSRVQVRYLAESTWGTTPSAAMTNLRATGFTARRNTQGTVSEEIRSDAQIPDWVRTGADVDGNIPFELVYGNLDDLLEGLLRSSWQTDTGFAGISSGTDLLTNSTTAKSFTLESEFSDITQFISYTGCRIGSLGLSVSPNSIITGDLGFAGKINAVAGATVGTGAAVAAPTSDPMNAVDHVTALTEGGSSVELLNLSLNVDNGLRMQPVIGSLGPSGIGYGRFNVTGSIEYYFADSTILAKYYAATETSLRVTLTDAAGNAYVLDLPAIKYTQGDDPGSQGNDVDTTVSLNFQGILDTTSSKTLRLTRNPA